MHLIRKNLGTCVVALNRYEGDLTGLKDEEWEEFSKIVKKLQSALKKSFNSAMFNWECLMNASYLKDPCFGFSTMKSKEGVRKIPENVRKKVIK